MSRVPGTRTSPAVYPGPIPGSHELGFVEAPIRSIDLNPAVRRVVHGDQRLPLDAFRMGECRILRAREPEGVHGEVRWHLSISCVDRHPTWDELKVARYRLLPPDVAVALILPPPQFYVNVPEQDHVFHLHEVEDAAAPWECM